MKGFPIKGILKFCSVNTLEFILQQEKDDEGSATMEHATLLFRVRCTSQ